MWLTFVGLSGHIYKVHCSNIGSLELRMCGNGCVNLLRGEIPFYIVTRESIQSASDALAKYEENRYHAIGY